MRMLNSDGEMHETRHSVQNSHDKNLRVVSREERERMERHRHTHYNVEKKERAKKDSEDGND
jgi:hypothetical protein